MNYHGTVKILSTQQKAAGERNEAHHHISGFDFGQENQDFVNALFLVCLFVSLSSSCTVALEVKR